MHNITSLGFEEFFTINECLPNPSIYFYIKQNVERKLTNIIDQTDKIWASFLILLFGLQREETISIFLVKYAKVVPRI